MSAICCIWLGPSLQRRGKEKKFKLNHDPSILTSERAVMIEEYVYQRTPNRHEALHTCASLFMLIIFIRPS